MKILIYNSIFVNIIAIIALILAMKFNLKNVINPKQKANVGYLVCFSMIIYLLFIAMVIILGLINRNYINVMLLLFIVLPFLIGKYSNYTKVLQYSIYQVLSYLGSLICLTYLVIH